MGVGGAESARRAKVLESEAAGAEPQVLCDKSHAFSGAQPPNLKNGCDATCVLRCWERGQGGTRRRAMQSAPDQCSLPPH